MSYAAGSDVLRDKRALGLFSFSLTGNILQFVERMAKITELSGISYPEVSLFVFVRNVLVTPMLGV